MTEEEQPPDLVFIHLSDIHFRIGRVGDVHDWERMLRNEFERDLRRLCTILPPPNGLIISGDIAFSGQPDEYEYARNWISSIQELIGCPHEGIMTIPGNHDVDRSKIPDPGEVQELQAAIRSKETTQEKDTSLNGILRNAGDAAALLRPIEAYNNFARYYGCDIAGDRPYWERRFPLKDGTSVRFRGITTTFLSGPGDNILTHKMIYGPGQRAFIRERNTRDALIGHHPPSWSFEGDDADRAFAAFTFLQAFGHKHDQWYTELGRSVRVISGAFHPDQGEPQWLPRYAAISIYTVSETKLLVRLHPRRWSDEEYTMIPDFNLAGRPYRDFEVRVEARSNN